MGHLIKLYVGSADSQQTVAYYTNNLVPLFEKNPTVAYYLYRLALGELDDWQPYQQEHLNKKLFTEFKCLDKDLKIPDGCRNIILSAFTFTEADSSLGIRDPRAPSPPPAP